MAFEFLFDKPLCLIIPSVEDNRMLGFWHIQILVTKQVYPAFKEKLSALKKLLTYKMCKYMRGVSI